MRRSFLALLLAFCLLAPRAALPRGREVGELVLLRALGVDRHHTGVELTASDGGGQGGEAPLVLRETGESVAGTCLKMQEGGRNLFLGHVGSLLLGEELARWGAGEVLEYVERDIEMRLGTPLYIIKDAQAAEALEGIQADTLEEFGNRAWARTVKELLVGLKQNGASFAPALRTGEEGLSYAGYALFRGESLVGYAQGEAAKGMDLLRGRGEEEVVELPLGEERAALRVVGMESAIRPLFEGETLTGLEIRCRVEANVIASPTPLTEESRESLTALLEEREKARIETALDLAQELGADFLGLGKSAALSCPWRREALERQWAQAFPTLECRVTAEGTLERSYDIK